MNASMSRIIATTVTFLSLSACIGGLYDSDESEHINYREKGEHATLDRITGVWKDSLDRYGSDSSLDLSYVVIRDNGEYINADYHGTPLSNGQVNCYDISESTITQLALGTEVVPGLFGLGGSSYEIFTYKESMGYYEVNIGYGFTYLGFEYDRLANTEAEMNFTPLCES